MKKKIKLFDPIIGNEEETAILKTLHSNFWASGQGIGQVLFEDIAFEEKSGQLWGGSLLDYCIPRADDLPFFRVKAVNNAPTTENPLGVKGGGEGGTIPALGAAVNAILDDLRPLGVTELTMPATPYSVWKAIQSAKTLSN